MKITVLIIPGNPVGRQIIIREQLFVCNYRFLWNAFCSRYHIVSNNNNNNILFCQCTLSTLEM